MNDTSQQYRGAGSRQTADKPIAEFWYAIQPQPNAILRFNEVHVDPYSVGDIWLIRGSARDLVIDTGSGIVPPAPLVEAVSGKAVLAVALNCFYDHAGGWHSFADRACHRLEAPGVIDPTEESSLASQYLTDDSLWALPYAGYSTTEYRMVAAAPTRLLEDGDQIDLGNRSLQILHAPGRSPGGITLWEAETGSLFTSDMLYDGAHGPAWPPEEPDAYAASLKRLRTLPVSRVYPGHYGPFGEARMRELIDEQLAALAQLA
jgi:glyoxylase-like metal-dependent hydrolase (beta-lactamase superfamily II)